MNPLRRLAALFQTLDTSEADAAIERLDASTRDVHVRARALRMDVGCGDPGEIADRVRALSGAMVHRGGRVLREVFAAPTREPLPTELQDLLGRIP